MNVSKKQVEAALRIFQNLRKARVHLNDEAFTEYFIGLFDRWEKDSVKKERERTALTIANCLGSCGYPEAAALVERIFLKEANGENNGEKRS